MGGWFRYTGTWPAKKGKGYHWGTKLPEELIHSLCCLRLVRGSTEVAGGPLNGILG